mgnify:CR=1 FL=1
MARLRDYASLLDTYLKHLELVLRSVEDPRVFEERIEVMYSTIHILQLAIQALLDMSLRLIAYIGAEGLRHMLKWPMCSTLMES